MTATSEQLQIRVTARQKATLKRLAAAAGQDVSAYVLSRALPEKRLEFASLLRSLEDEADRRYALAELRLGEEFHDLDDVRYLLRYLKITTAQQAVAIVKQYFDEAELLPKSRLALEALLPA